MPIQVENPGEPEEYIRGFRRREYPDWRTAPPKEYPPVSEPTDGPTPAKGVDIGLFGPVKCLLYGALFVAGMAVHAIFIAPEPASTEVPDPPGIEVQVAPAPTVTVTKMVLSAACNRALVGMSEVIDSAAAIAGVQEKQLDIFAEARQAIVMKDFRRINRLEERQRALDGSIMKQQLDVLPKVAQIKKDLAACLRSVE